MGDGLPVAAVADFLPFDLIDGGAGEEVQAPNSTHPLHGLDGYWRLAGFVAEQLDEEVFALLHQFERAGDNRRPLLRRCRGPGAVVESVAGRGDRGVDVGCRRTRPLAGG